MSIARGATSWRVDRLVIDAPPGVDSPRVDSAAWPPGVPIGVPAVDTLFSRPSDHRQPCCRPPPRRQCYIVVIYKIGVLFRQRERIRQRRAELSAELSRRPAAVGVEDFGAAGSGAARVALSRYPHGYARH
uniref:Uncharacterized protein n=1 Tax=Arundo donax TaxID=35708 RepID=A0A0A9HHG4_ARUDO